MHCAVLEKVPVQHLRSGRACREMCSDSGFNFGFVVCYFSGSLGSFSGRVFQGFRFFCMTLNLTSWCDNSTSWCDNSTSWCDPFSQVLASKARETGGELDWGKRDTRGYTPLMRYLYLGFGLRDPAATPKAPSRPITDHRACPATRTPAPRAGTCARCSCCCGPLPRSKVGV